MPPRKREYRRTNPQSWQNDPDKDSEVNRHGRKRKGEKTYLDHPKNEQGVNICYANLDKGGHCQLAAGRFTDHEGYGKCSLHGGNTPTLRASAANYVGGEIIHRMTQAYGYGGPLELTPHDALLQEVRRGGGHVAHLQERLNLLSLQLGTEVMTPAQVELLELYQKERLMLVKNAKTAVDAGVAEARVQLERDKGVLLVQALREVFDGLGLSVEQQRLLPTLVPAALRKLTEPVARMQIEQAETLPDG